MEIRPAKPEDTAGIARVHTEAWQTTYEGILDANFLNSLSAKDREKRWSEILKQTDHITFVAEEEGQIIGFTSGGPDRSENAAYDAELYSIYLLKDWRGKKVGERLFSELTSALYKEGFHSMITWVAEENPYSAFYSAMGGRKLPIEKTGQIGEQVITITAYGWSDLTHL